MLIRFVNLRGPLSDFLSVEDEEEAEEQEATAASSLLPFPAALQSARAEPIASIAHRMTAPSSSVLLLLLLYRGRCRVVEAGE